MIVEQYLKKLSSKWKFLTSGPRRGHVGAVGTSITFCSQRLGFEPSPYKSQNVYLFGGPACPFMGLSGCLAFHNGGGHHDSRSGRTFIQRRTVGRFTVTPPTERFVQRASTPVGNRCKIQALFPENHRTSPRNIESAGDSCRTDEN